MNKLIKMLALCVLTSASMSADNCNPCSTPCSPCGKQHNKTRMTPRSHGVNLALEYTDGWRNLMERECKDKYGGNFQLAFFYEASTKGYELGRYFSPRVEASDDCNTDCNTACASTCTPCNNAPDCNVFSWGTSLSDVGDSNESVANQLAQSTVSQDLNLRSFIQLPFESILTYDGNTLADGTPITTINTQTFENASQALKMDRRTYGFLLNYHQNLDCLYKGLYFKVNLPIAHVENRIKCCLEANDWTIAGVNVTDDVSTPVSFSVAGSDIETMIQNFLDGDTVTVPLNKWSTDNDATDDMADVVLQEALCRPTIPCGCEDTCASTCNPCGDNRSSKKRHKSKTGVADLDIQLGYDFLHNKNYHHTIAFGLTIPTGTGPKGRRIWEPEIGYHNHLGVGFSFNGDVNLWCGEDQKLVLFHAMNYRYLLSHREHRTLGLCGQNWGHFQLLGKLGQATLVPAANVLTTKVDVKLGNQIDYILGLNYVCCGFSLDLGYNLFYRDREHIHIKNCDCLLTENTYAFPSPNYRGVDIVSSDDADDILLANNGGEAGGGADGSTGFQQGNRLNDNGSGVGGTWLSNSDVDKKVAETPRQLSNKIFAGIGYTVKCWEIPFLIGVGGHYEFGNKHTTLSTWGVNAKLAISF